MADIKFYTPTAGMTAAERTQQGYYEVIKKWVQDTAPEVFDKWFDITFADDSFAIMFTPKNDNIALRILSVKITTSLYLNFEYPYDDAPGKSAMVKQMMLSQNPQILVYSGGDFFIGDAANPCIYGICSTTDFNGNAEQYALGWRNAALMVFSSGKMLASYSGAGITQRSRGRYPEYVIQQFIIDNSNIIPKNLFYLDGGLSVPTGIFRINKKKYCVIQGNIICKIG